MTAHTHREIVPGCYRCELGRDEARAVAREQLIEDARQAGWDVWNRAGAWVSGSRPPSWDAAISAALSVFEGAYPGEAKQNTTKRFASDDEREAPEAPVWLDANEASAWQSGWTSGWDAHRTVQGEPSGQERDLERTIADLGEELQIARERCVAAVEVMNQHRCGEQAERAFQRAERAESALRSQGEPSDAQVQRLREAVFAQSQKARRTTRDGGLYYPSIDAAKTILRAAAETGGER